MIVWSCRLGFAAIVGGAFVGVYGCGLDTRRNWSCAETLTCEPIVSGGENCQNGIDDDKDGSADCADSDCTNLVACNALSDDWEYRTMVFGPHDPNAAIVPCFDGAIAERLFDGHLGQPQCKTCICTTNDPNGLLQCDGAPVLECTDNLQGAKTDWTPISSNSGVACPAPAELKDMTHCRLAAPVTIAKGSCTASVTSLVDSRAWTRDVFACPVAIATLVDEIGTCIRHEGEVATCPDGWSGARHVVYKSESGTRKCVPCDCTGECEATISVYDNAGCSGTPTPIDSISPKYVLNKVDNTYSIRKWQPNPPKVCTPTGGEPVEEVKPAGPVTFCCK